LAAASNDEPWPAHGVDTRGAGGVAVGEFATSPGGDGAVSVARIDPPPVPSSLEIAALAAGSKWTTVSPDTGQTVVTYSFAHAGSVFAYSAPAFAATLTSFSEADQALTRAVLARIAAVCNVVFVEVPDTATTCGALRYAYSQQPAAMGLSGFAFYPSAEPAGGDVWISAVQATPTWDFYRPALLLHETLHALGLKHPFDAGPTLPSQQNIIPNTVMSYSPVPGSSNGLMSRYPAEPMPLDIAALHYLYGAAPTQAGDTVYRLAGADFQGGFRTIWDAGGHDVLDASGLARGVTLDLNPGGRGNIGVAVTATGTVGGLPMSTTYAQTLAIAFGTRIEDVVGTAAADLLIGNEAANRLRGGGGDDRIEGGAGVDTAVFAGPRAEHVVTPQAGGLQVADTAAARDGTDWLLGVERLAFGDITLAFDADGSGGAAFRLYQAAFGRAADPGGLGYWIGVLDRGAGLHEVAAGFTGSQEFAVRYGSPDHAGFVSQLYANVLHRTPDEPGLAFHVGTLAAGATDRPQVLVNFSESPEHQAALLGTIQQGVAYT